MKNLLLKKPRRTARPGVMGMGAARRILRSADEINSKLHDFAFRLPAASAFEDIKLLLVLVRQHPGEKHLLVASHAGRANGDGRWLGWGLLHGVVVVDG